MGKKTHLEDLTRRGRSMCNSPKDWKPEIVTDPDCSRCGTEIEGPNNLQKANAPLCWEPRNHPMTNPPAATVEACPSCRQLPTKYSTPQTDQWVKGKPDTYRVHCQCGMTGPHAPSGSDAITAWNRIASLTTQAVEPEILDIEATAQNIARHLSEYKESGRHHASVYANVKAGALMALQLVAPPSPKTPEQDT